MNIVPISAFNACINNVNITLDTIRMIQLERGILSLCEVVLLFDGKDITISVRGIFYLIEMVLHLTRVEIIFDRDDTTFSVREYYIWPGWYYI